jgi:23S rRNA pseudouridine1911/1915/1917 synthase
MKSRVMASDGSRQEIRIPATLKGQRVDVALTQLRPDFSRSTIVRLIREGAILRHGCRIKSSDRIKSEMQLTLQLPAPPVAKVLPENLPLIIHYQDEDLAVIEKAAGVVVHPAPGHPEHTMVNALLYHLPDLADQGEGQRPGIVHRLDKDTSGLLLIAKTTRAQRSLSEAIKARIVHRTYDAWVWGKPEQSPFTIETQLGRDYRDRKRFRVVRQGGRIAKTTFTVVTTTGAWSWIKAQLHTGRTHQIRVHCHYLHIPLVGDRTYGYSHEESRLRSWKITRPLRQMLHASELQLEHPFTHQPLSFKAPWPQDMQDFYACIKKRE